MSEATEAKSKTAETVETAEKPKAKRVKVRGEIKAKRVKVRGEIKAKRAPAKRAKAKAKAKAEAKAPAQAGRGVKSGRSAAKLLYMTPGERKRLNAAARSTGLPANEIVRRLLGLYASDEKLAARVSKAEA